MTHEQQENVWSAFTVVVRWLIKHGAHFVAVMAAVVIIGQPHFESYAESLIVRETSERFETVEKGLADQTAATESNTQAIGKLGGEVGDLKTAVDKNTDGISRVESALETQNGKLDTLLELLRPLE